MKKLLLLMALMLSFSFASYAETYTFTTEGLTNANAVSELKSTDNNITVTFEKNTGSNAPTYYTSGDCIRMYKNNSFTITASEDVTINSVSYVWVKKGSKWTNPTVSTKSLTVENNQAKFVASAKDNGPRSITVEYTVSSTAKDPAGLAFAEEAYTANLGEDFTAELTNPNGLEVTYKSSNEAVATVTTDGTVNILTAGTTTITATSEETEVFKAGEASYKLTVIDPNSTEDEIVFESLGYSDGTALTTVTKGKSTLTFAKGSNSNNAPKYYVSDKTARLYSGNTLTIAVDESCYITEIVFGGSTLDALTASAGSYNNETWTPTVARSDNKISNVTFTATGKPKFSSITVKYALIPSGIADIEAEENGAVEYFNLQGVRVAEPANGLYIRRAGNKVEKVVIR